MKLYSLFLADATTRLPIGTIEAVDFMTAAKLAAAQIASNLKRLEMPGWRIEDASGESTDIAAVRPRRAPRKVRS
jgi:hypothetical protein